MAENVQDGGSLSHVYRLYDEGLNARLAGNYEEATKKLLAAATAYTSSKSGLTFEAMINFELGQAAESSGNVSVAADAYTRCLRIKPSFVDASVHLANMLMRAGEAKAALTQARETAVANPTDARAHELLGLVLDKNGFADDAKLERSKAEALLQRHALPNPASLVHQAPVPEPVAPQPSTTDDKDAEVSAPEKKPVEQPVDSDVMKE
jgi:tetratricopeptide (TPR) repeat protein